jgi:hypothetical protein
MKELDYLYERFIDEALTNLTAYHLSDDTDRYAKGVSDAYTMAARIVAGVASAVAHGATKGGRA